MLDPKTSQMFYFTGKKHTTPNCPLEIVPDFNPSAGVPSYLKSDSKCSRNAKYFIPFFLERPGPRYMQWSVNAHEARPGHHTQVSAIAGQLLERFGFDCFKTKKSPHVSSQGKGEIMQGDNLIIATYMSLGTGKTQ